MRNLALLWMVGIGVLGEATGAEGITPRLSGGHPDLNGTWENGGGIWFLRPQFGADGSVCVSGCAPAASAGAAAERSRPAPDRPRYKPQFEAKVRDLEARQQKMDPVLRCQPPGVPRIGPPDKILHTARELVFLYEDVSGPFFRIVPLRPDIKRIDASESYLGDAVGHWEGDTLVVKTTNFNDLTWLTDDGAFHTDKLQVTEYLTRRGDEIQYRALADDPDVLAEPWQQQPRRLIRSEIELSEPAPCVEQDLEHMVDETHHDNPR